MSLLVAPSLLSADFAGLREEVEDMVKAGADHFHLDIMDGHFVPNLTFGPMVAKAIRSLTSLPLDAHLMVTNPDVLLNALHDANVDSITVHSEGYPNVLKTLQAIKALGLKAGLALNPNTSANILEDLLDHIDIVLVMTVNPGFGGQTFMEEVLPKIKAIRAMINHGNHKIQLQVDGGVNSQTVKYLQDADLVVAGMAAFGGGKSKYKENINALKGQG